MEKEEDKRHWR